MELILKGKYKGEVIDFPDRVKFKNKEADNTEEFIKLLKKP